MYTQMFLVYSVAIGKTDRTHVAQLRGKCLMDTVEITGAGGGS